jgi:hypothetical protein
MTAAVIFDTRTISGVTYLSSDDVADALRHRADECTEYALSLGDDLDDDGYLTSVAWHTVAAELHARADAIQFAVIAHLTDEPGDSDLTHNE